MQIYSPNLKNANDGSAVGLPLGPREPRPDVLHRHQVPLDSRVLAHPLASFSTTLFHGSRQLLRLRRLRGGVKDSLRLCRGIWWRHSQGWIAAVLFHRRGITKSTVSLWTVPSPRVRCSWRFYIFILAELKNNMLLLRSLGLVRL